MPAFVPYLGWLLVLFVYLAAACGVGRMLREERRRPTSYTRSPEYLAGLEEPPVVAVEEVSRRMGGERL